MASTTHVAIVICQKTSALRIICRVSLFVGVIEQLEGLATYVYV